MLFIDSFGKNIYVDNILAGYISMEGTFYAKGQSFGNLTDSGDIYFNGEYVGYIEDNGDIYIREAYAGYVENGDLYFDSLAMNNN